MPSIDAPPKVSFLDVIGIAATFLLINSALFLKMGPMIVTDSPRYLDYAKGLENGFYLEPHNVWYIGYVVFIYFVRLFSESVAALVFFQCALALISVICLFLASVSLFGSKRSGYMTLFFYFIFIELSSWNAYVLAESVFVSLICITLYALVSFARIRALKTKIVLLLPVSFLVIFTSLVKPTGIAVISTVLFVALYFSWQVLKNFWLRMILLSVVLVGSLILINRMLSTYLVIENYAQGEVISYVRGVKGYQGTDVFVLETPKNMSLPGTDMPPLLRIAVFIFNYPVYWLKLFSMKVFFLLAHVRPFWSTAHNFLSLIVLVPAYLIAAIGFHAGRRHVTNIAMLVFLMINILSVGMTSEDWDGRFLMPMLPVIFLLAGNGLNQILTRRKYFGLF